MRRPLHRQQRDYRLVVHTSLDLVVEHLNGPAAIASWFDGIERHEIDADHACWSLSGTRLEVCGRETWDVEQSSLVFRSSQDDLLVSFSVREIMVSEPLGFGTEMYAYIDVRTTRRGRRLLRAFTRVAIAGLRHLEAEMAQ